MVDLSVFQRQKSIVDQQQLQEAFKAKKQMMALQEMGALAQIQKSMQGGDAPSAVREYEYYNSLSPEDQQKFITVKRADKALNMGDFYGRIDPVTKSVQPFGGGNIGLSPEQKTQQALKSREAEDMFNRGLEVKQKALDGVKRLLANPSGVRANRGGISTLFPNISNSAVDAAADLENVANLLTTENLGLLKGVLSDTDMRVLASIGSGEFQGSDKKTMDALRRMDIALSGKVDAGKQAQAKGFEGMPPLLSSPAMQGGAPAIDKESAKAELRRRGLIQ